MIEFTDKNKYKNMFISEELLKEKLFSQELITQEKFNLLSTQSKNEGKSLVEMLFEKEVISDDKLGKIIAEILNVQFVRLSETTLKENLLKIIPVVVAAPSAELSETISVTR